MQTRIDSEVFQISPATYLRVVAGSTLPSLLASILLLALIALGAGVIFDTRIILVALILIFLIFPFFIYYIYFTRLLTTEAQYCIRPKSVIIEPKVRITERFHCSDESNPTPQPRTHAWEMISCARADSHRLIIYFRDQSAPLIIPLNALPADCRSLLETMPQPAN